MNRPRFSRRSALRCGAFSVIASSSIMKLLAADAPRTFKIGACDWSMNCRHDPRSLDVAKRVGLDGVQVSFGEKGVEYDLRKPEVRRLYLDKCQALKLEIASLGLGALNQKPYASDPDAEQWVVECIDVMTAMKQQVALLAFFSEGDIQGNAAAQAEVVRRLKKVAPRAEKAGVILGIESWLNADDHLRILDAVGSPAVQVYYDVANMQLRGYDIYQEIRQLGRDRICQIHAKENASLLGKGKIDFVKVREALDDIQWSGWLVIEAATEAGKFTEDAYRRNQQYLRSVFPTEA